MSDDLSLLRKRHPVQDTRNLPRRMRLKHHPCRESGIFAVMTAPLMLVLIAFSGLALEAGMVYNRVVDLQGMAKAVALAAANQLNGRPDGLVAAQAKAKETAEYLKYKYFNSGVSFVWKDAALSFGTSPSRSGD